MARDRGQRARSEVERELIALAEKVFDSTDQVNSLALTVAQYFCDEAEDAVHCDLVYSSRATPLVGHRCSYRETTAPDFCGSCKPKGLPIPRWAELSWDDNDPETISAFEGFCREDSEGEGYLTYAIVRRGEGLERVGRPVRPWFDEVEPAEHRPPSDREAELLSSVYAAPDEDGPRAVLADWWLSQEDPRGELVQLQLRGVKDAEGRAREEALLEAQRGALLGPIAAVIPKGGMVFRRGLLHEAEVVFPSKKALALAAEPVWGTVEILHFLDDKHQRLHPAMSALRVVSGVSKAALKAAVAGSGTYPIEDLAVDFPIAEAAELLKDARCFPKLRRLEGGPGLAQDLPKLARNLPDTVRCIGLTGDLRDLAAQKQWWPGLQIEWEIEWVCRPDRGRVAGWRFLVTREGEKTQLRCVLDNLRIDASMPCVWAIRDAIGGEVDVTLVPSRYYDPRPDDLAVVTSETDPEER